MDTQKALDAAEKAINKAYDRGVEKGKEAVKYKYDNRYLKRFFKLNTAPLLLESNVFPNIKEITESMGAFAAIQNHLVGKYVDRSGDVDVFVVGDGNSPRTGALIACLTKWDVVSVDPRMRDKAWNIKRLRTYKNKVENLNFLANTLTHIKNTAIVVCVHSHAKTSDSLNMVHGYSNVHLINIPCCFEADIEKKPDISYLDNGIQSEKQRVDIYLNC